MLITANLIPTLIDRGVLSLKKATDIKDGLDGDLSMMHISSMKYEPDPATSWVFSTRLTDDLLETWLSIDSHNDIPFDSMSSFNARNQSIV